MAFPHKNDVGKIILQTDFSTVYQDSTGGEK